MRTRLKALVAICILSTAAPLLAQEMPPGKWQIKTKIEMPGMPADMVAKMGAQVFTQCIVAGKNKWSDEHSPSAQRNCERTDLKVSGNEVSWKMKCKEGISGDGKVKHNGKDAYTMTLNMTAPRGVMKIQSEGKLLSLMCDRK